MKTVHIYCAIGALIILGVIGYFTNWFGLGTKKLASGGIILPIQPSHPIPIIIPIPGNTTTGTSTPVTTTPIIGTKKLWNFNFVQYLHGSTYQFYGDKAIPKSINKKVEIHFANNLGHVIKGEIENTQPVSLQGMPNRINIDLGMNRPTLQGASGTIFFI